MKPEDAIKMLDQAVSQIQASREAHVALQQAIEVVKAATATKKS